MAYKEYTQLNLTETADQVRERWKQENIYRKSIDSRPEARRFVFYEGPPSANGKPGIHHALGRTIKDIFCRYKTLKGYRVERKSGWDTHGLPVELQVEKRLGLRKEDIGKKISVAEYNRECREDVMKFQDIWESLTEQLGYWIDQSDPYVTYHTPYMETLWWMLRRLYDRNLLYMGYTIQPYSPAAGTGLSSHELNQPGTYREVKDVSCVAQFRAVDEDAWFLAWTTTPWTLPSNTALAVGKNIEYVRVETINPYTHLPVSVYLAAAALPRYFKPERENADPAEYANDGKNLPWRISARMTGEELAGRRYEQLMPYVQPEGDAFRVIIGDFVSTEDGTGIVHIAPTFGADDMRVAKEQGIAPLTVPDPENPRKEIPLVDKEGKFVPQVTDFAGRYVKNYRDDANYEDVNVDIVIMLKKQNKCFKSEKYEHNYPHCWRTDKPVLYYPLEAWFIRTTAFRDRMIALNETIRWKPASTGTGRFANWLENLVDWNLSRSRFWGTPLPIWTTEDGSEKICIGSIAELVAESEKAVAAGLMDKAVSPDTDLHRPYVDEITLVSPTGKAMKRVPDVIDVWFDSGAMPYAQWHYPFENKEKFAQNFPADFIAEGVDQTRGWFFTLHALATMLFDSVAFKTVVSNGLVLDKNGQKMSKRLGNVVDPFETINTYGADATRFYMVANAQPWDNLKFDIAGLEEVRRKFFGTLYNTYQFFALYANIDGFNYSEARVPVEQRPEIDRWIISLLQGLVEETGKAYEEYEPTRAARAISGFTIENLSNWYVRLCRRRFWKGDMSPDKLSAYQTLYECLETIARLMSPIAPFFADQLFTDLNSNTGRDSAESVHLTYFPESRADERDPALEARMDMAQRATSLILSLRKKAQIRVRQPLARVMIPVMNATLLPEWKKVEELIKNEVNVKELQYLSGADTGILVKQAKPDFKKLGPKYGKLMKEAQQAILAMTADEIATLEQEGSVMLQFGGEAREVTTAEVEIVSNDIPGWLVAAEGGLTVALDITLTPELEREGLARELVNRIQNMRKAGGLEVTDRINVQIEDLPAIREATDAFGDYICGQTLADSLELTNDMPPSAEEQDLEGISARIAVSKV